MHGTKRFLAPLVALLVVITLIISPAPTSQSAGKNLPSVAQQIVTQSDQNLIAERTALVKLKTSRQFHRSPVNTTATKSPAKPKKHKYYAPKPIIFASAPWRTEPVRLCIRKYESGNNYARVSTSGIYFGAYQMSDPTWQHASGLSGHASSYPAATQDAAFRTMTRRIKTGAIMQAQFSTYRLCR